MKYFAQLDADGFPAGFWNDDVFPDQDGTRHPSIPADVVEITAQQWRAFIDNPGLRRWDNGHVVPYAPPGPTPEEMRRLAFPPLAPDQFWFLLRASGYAPDLLAWVAAMNDPDSPIYDPVSWAAASAKLDFARSFERDDPFVEEARAAIGMSAGELDALWAFERP